MDGGPFRRNARLFSILIVPKLGPGRSGDKESPAAARGAPSRSAQKLPRGGAKIKPTFRLFIRSIPGSPFLLHRTFFFFFLFGAVEWLNCACCALKTSRQPVHRCSLRPFPRCLRRNIFRSSRNMPFESHRRRETRFRRRGSSTRTGAVVCRPRNEAGAVAPK